MSSLSASAIFWFCYSSCVISWRTYPSLSNHGGDFIEAQFVKSSLDTFTILVDSREHENLKYHQRLARFSCPVIKTKLDFGDYSAQVTLPSGVSFSLANKVSLERKAGYDELTGNFTTNRDRFKREFERAKAKDAKVYLLIEQATWEKAYHGYYRSQMKPQALVASMTTWMARYDTPILMCNPETSGQLIYDVLYREMKEALINL